MILFCKKYKTFLNIIDFCSYLKMAKQDVLSVALGIKNLKHLRKI